MNELTIINQNGKLVTDSREVADMVDKRHSDLLKDIRGYIEHLENGTFRSQNFFIPSNYKTKGNNKTYDCYLITKNGCDMVANKMTGEKGILFTATYVTKFDEMEQALKTPILKSMTQTELTAAIAQNQVEIEHKVNSLDTKITNALDVFTTPAKDDWRHEMNEKVNGMCITQGLNYQTFKHEIYTELDDIAGVNLSSRQSRLRARMKKGGFTATECRAISKIEVIERDIKLKPIFEGIVRKYQAKYAVV